MKTKAKENTVRYAVMRVHGRTVVFTMTDFRDKEQQKARGEWFKANRAADPNWRIVVSQSKKNPLAR